jgi:hypothetical protein
VSEDLSKAPPMVGERGVSRDDEVDPELLGLPDPPKKERTMTLVLLAVTALAALAMVFALRRDAAYAFASTRAAELGDLRSAAAGAFADNLFVEGFGMLGAAGAIRYERPFEEDSYRLSPVAGRSDLWVEVRVPAGQENARYVPPTHFDGRLVRLDRAGPRHRGLAKAALDATGQEVPANAWLLVDDEAPSNARWAVALVALFLAFAVWNLAAIARLVRRVA